ncbi:MAG TPA: 4Fe-4S dicluster domain-containing protein [Acidimicrobiales bacterium]
MTGTAGVAGTTGGTAGVAGAAGATTVLTRGTVTIDRERCKGCELCIPACRPGVLSMSTEVNAIGYRYPVLAPGCTGCQACHAVCPDFVFEVYKFAEPVVLAVLAAPAPTDAPTEEDR